LIAVADLEGSELAYAP